MSLALCSSVSRHSGSPSVSTTLPSVMVAPNSPQRPASFPSIMSKSQQQHDGEEKQMIRADMTKRQSRQKTAKRRMKPAERGKMDKLVPCTIPALTRAKGEEENNVRRHQHKRKTRNLPLRRSRRMPMQDSHTRTEAKNTNDAPMTSKRTAEKEKKKSALLWVEHNP